MWDTFPLQPTPGSDVPPDRPMPFSIARLAVLVLYAVCHECRRWRSAAGRVPAVCTQFCAKCHSADAREGGFDLASLVWQPTEPANFERWVKIFDRVDRGEMPPAAEPRPPRSSSRASPRSAANCMRSTMPRNSRMAESFCDRLNRVEYENTVHDLLGIDTPLREMLPEDMPLEGFDTVADGLRLSPLHMESISKRPTWRSTRQSA